ncbi:MAG: hypothetical protein KF713_18575 [Turneriella sp.]|nr:hypothetical protein [Turneriella sp.]
MKNYKLLKASSVLILPIFMLRSACVSTTNDPEQRTQSMSYYLGIGGNSKAKEQLLAVINSAKTEIVGVFNDLADTEVSSALINQANAGLKVAIGGDKRNQASAGFQALIGQRPSKFQTYFAATTAANAETNENVKKNILKTRLNFNRNTHPSKPRYDASSFDGRVEYNFVVADKTFCWISTGGANSTTFNTGQSVVFVFQSFDICNDFYNEAQQLAYGGLFGDEGAPSFGKFRYSKTITDPNTRFRLGDLIFNIYFAPQERPLTPVVTELMRSEKSIKFAARALTQDIINDVGSHTLNRSHLLNAFQYKATIPAVYGQSFSIKGVIGAEVDANQSSITTPWSGTGRPYDSLISGSCPTINAVATGGLRLPFYDGSSTVAPGNTYCHLGGTNNSTDCNAGTTLTNQTSIHCDLATLQTTVSNANIASFRKYPTTLPYNIFLTDYGSRKPRLVVMSSDLRKRYYYDDGGSQDNEPKRTRDDFFPITDAFVLIIEPAGSATEQKIFNDFNTLLDTLIGQGGSL